MFSKGPVSLDWDAGLQRLLNKFKNRPDLLRKAVAPAVFMEAEETVSEAKAATPVLHGHLRASGHVKLPVVEEDKVSVEFGFGGVAGIGNTGGETNTEAVGYAVPVHEDLTKNHTVGGAKYLENPLNQRKATMSERMSGRIKARLHD